MILLFHSLESEVMFTNSSVYTKCIIIVHLNRYFCDCWVFVIQTSSFSLPSAVMLNWSKRLETVSPASTLSSCGSRNRRKKPKRKLRPDRSILNNWWPANWTASDKSLMEWILIDFEMRHIIYECHYVVCSSLFDLTSETVFVLFRESTEWLILTAVLLRVLISLKL